ncbi:hypothetical protein DFQ11_101397 [Winogradskyella epiphytica]|uniref:Uncharacterized protein n=1 Tax=Winogradskyella epiphytica TaxID=262005 RepID=A0A2V4XVY4_9FLAO|nr:hypothetical protein [Winogradskyella epiphytica]PYE82967.1 hypothetical protein DFQ11_101397 [Winogradskyella epiphytica]GGW54881.1 hypothetical protein GCM10008085_02660 [Winogradskyella epiphytica]
MKTYLIMLSIFVLMAAFQSNRKEGDSLGATLEKEQKSQNNVLDSSKTQQPFNDFFPIELGDYKLIEVSESTLLSRKITSAFYLKGEDMKNNIEYSLEDGNKKGSSVVEDFERSYKYQNKGEGNTEYIYKERDGYKTIAFLQPEENRNEIRFIYKQRFSLVLEGTEQPDKLWSYIKDEDLKKLDSY